MMKRGYTQLAAAGLLTLACMGNAAAAAPTAADVLKAGTAYMSGLDAIETHASLKADMKKNEETQNIEAETWVRLQGKESLRTEVKAGDVEAALISNGEKTVFYQVSRKQYREDAPETRETLLGAFPGDMFREGMTWLSNYVHADAALTGEDNGATYVGLEKITVNDNERECHHLHFAREDHDVDAWIEKGERPVPWQIKVDFAKTLSGLTSPDAPDSVVITYAFQDWEPNAKLEKAIFTFEAPEGVTKAEPETTGPEQALVGRAAPTIELDLLDGSKFKLADHKGKDIVILDFWATWCGPCRVGLPMVTEAAAAFKKQNVVFYAVNIQESPEQVKAFVASTGLDLTVAMDPDGSAAGAYGAYSIPHTVIVGKDGIVRKVHSGVMPNYKEMLMAELKSLAAE